MEVKMKASREPVLGSFFRSLLLFFSFCEKKSLLKAKNGKI